MKFDVKREDILNEINYVASIAEKSTKMPILSHILISTDKENGLLKLSGSDLELSLKTSCPAEIAEDGAAAVPARKLLDIVRYLPEGITLHFESEDTDRIIIKSGKSKFRIVSLPHDTFPIIPECEHWDVKIPSVTLFNMIKRTIFSITQEQARFTLNGIKMEINSNFIKMVSTDGHRLAYIESPKEFLELKYEIKKLIPKKTVAELMKILQSANTEVNFAIDENHIYFKIDQRLMVSSVLAGQFPNYEILIPQNNKFIIEFQTEVLKRVVSRISVLSDNISRKVVFDIKPGLVHFHAAELSVGEADEELDIEFDDQPQTLGFNSQYLLEFLSVVENPTIIFKFTDDETPALFMPKDSVEYTYKYVLMPMV